MVVIELGSDPASGSVNPNAPNWDEKGAKAALRLPRLVGEDDDRICARHSTDGVLFARESNTSGHPSRPRSHAGHVGTGVGFGQPDGQEYLTGGKPRRKRVALFTVPQLLEKPDPSTCTGHRRRETHVIASQLLGHNTDGHVLGRHMAFDVGVEDGQQSQVSASPYQLFPASKVMLQRLHRRSDFALTEVAYHPSERLLLFREFKEHYPPPFRIAARPATESRSNRLPSQCG